MPPIAFSVSPRISMQPPAAAALSFRITHAGGYSLKKKKTKAGTNNFSAHEMHLRRTITLTKS